MRFLTTMVAWSVLSLAAGATALAGEADRGRNDELNPGSDQPFRQRLPVAHRQDQPEMRNRHVIAIDRIGGAGLAKGDTRPRG